MRRFIKKTLKFINLKIYEYIYLISNYLNTNYGLSKNQDSEIIINLTSHLSRLPYCYLTIETLLQQSLKPTRIILWLSEQEVSPKDLPKTLLRQKKRGLEIRFMKENYKSFNKLIFALREFPQAILITADDDIYYPRWWLEKMYQAYLDTPQCIICYRAHPILVSPNDENNILPYKKWVNAKFLSTEPSLHLFPTGVAGVLYFPNSLPTEVQNTAVFQELCPNADDVWFKCMSLLKEIKCRKIFEENTNFKTVLNTQKTALHHRNLYQNENDLPIKRLFERYKILHYLNENSLVDKNYQKIES